jgi:hypothetical protein
VSLDRVLSLVRTGVAGLAIAVALLLLFKVPLISTFRMALIVLAALELLVDGRRALGPGGIRAGLELALKLAVLATAYVVLGS